MNTQTVAGGILRRSNRAQLARPLKPSLGAGVLTNAPLPTGDNVGKVYTVVAYRSVSDPAALAACAELAGPAILAGGGRIPARGMPLATFDGGLNQRMVIVEWDDLEQAIATRRSEAYQAARAKLGHTAERDIRIIEGVT